MSQLGILHISTGFCGKQNQRSNDVIGQTNGILWWVKIRAALRLILYWYVFQ